MRINTPTLFTVNGMGLTLLPTVPCDPLREYTLYTYWLTFVFYVPILPLGLYVGRKESTSYRKQTYSFLGQIPVGNFVRLYGLGGLAKAFAVPFLLFWVPIGLVALLIALSQL